MPRITTKLVHKDILAENMVLATFKLATEVVIHPGHIVTLEVEPRTFRQYSVVEAGSSKPFFVNQSLPDLETGEIYVTFLVSTNTEGSGSNFFRSAQLGQTVSAIGPSGRMKLEDNTLPKVFVATGAGLAPFIGMINQAGRVQPEIPVKLFLGLRHNFANFSRDFFAHPNLELFVTISGQTYNSNWPDFVTAGRINQVFKNKIDSNFAALAEFYLCGNPEFVASTRELLTQLNAASVIEESFGNIIK